MGPGIRGLVLDSSVLVAAERTGLTTLAVIQNIRNAAGDVPVVISAPTVAELAHGIYRADSKERASQRRRFLDEIKTHVPVHPVTEAAAEIIAKIGGEQEARGIRLPLADLVIGACAVELGYGVVTKNLRDFNRIPSLPVLQL